VAATVGAALLPLSDAAREAIAADQSLLACALGGGDDYELLFTAPPEARAAVQAAAAAVAVTRIGTVQAGEGVTAIDGDGRPLAPAMAGWRHF
jgi:thiamine-monophosphate kinase